MSKPPCPICKSHFICNKKDHGYIFYNDYFYVIFYNDFEIHSFIDAVENRYSSRPKCTVIYKTNILYPYAIYTEHKSYSPEEANNLFIRIIKLGAFL